MYKEFVLEEENGRFVFHHPDKEDGTGNWSGWAVSEKDAKDQIDELIDGEARDQQTAKIQEHALPE
jgi:hypothetical protein